MKDQEEAIKAKRRHQRSDDGNAFIPDPESGPARTNDDLAESLAERFLQGATQDDDAEEATLDGLVPEEIGGPFVETKGSAEFAEGTDGSNPVDADREPLPRAVGELPQDPKVDGEGEPA